MKRLDMKKIIVPTDFSDCANNALKAASDIARKGNAEIHLVHVYERPVWGFAEVNVDIVKNRQVHDKIEEELYRASALPFMRGIKVVKHIFADIKINKALGHKKLSDADLIVMGSHGISGWREFFIGSNTEKVIRYVDIPVLVIKEWYENFEVRNMVFASNFFREADDSFMKIENLSRLFVSKIHLLKVITPGNFEPSYNSINLMKDFARRQYLSSFSINTYNDDTVEDGVLNFCKTAGIDLISMETHGRTGLAHLINGSITENVVNHVSMPVLSVRIKYEPLRTELAVPPKV
jgi:nucleotide-binding universal stress UspA family protein